MMKDLDVALLIIAVAVSIFYLIYVIWNAFITKKQIMLSAIDVICLETASIFGGSRLYDLYGIKGVVATFAIVILWVAALSARCSMNKDEQDNIY